MTRLFAKSHVAIQRHRHTGGTHVTAETDWSAASADQRGPVSARSHQKLGWGRKESSRPAEMLAPAMPSQTSGPQNVREQISVLLKPPSLWSSVLAALGNEYTRKHEPSLRCNHQIYINEMYQCRYTYTNLYNQHLSSNGFSPKLTLRQRFWCSGLSGWWLGKLGGGRGRWAGDAGMCRGWGKIRWLLEVILRNTK